MQFQLSHGGSHLFSQISIAVAVMIIASKTKGSSLWSWKAQRLRDTDMIFEGIQVHLYACIIWHHFVQTTTCSAMDRSSSSHVLPGSLSDWRNPWVPSVSVPLEQMAKKKRWPSLSLRSVVHQWVSWMRCPSRHHRSIIPALIHPAAAAAPSGIGLVPLAASAVDYDKILSGSMWTASLLWQWRCTNPFFSKLWHSGQGVSYPEQTPPRACLDSKFFSLSPSHRIFGHMYGAVNIGKKN
jgi:hypothetical protein